MPQASLIGHNDIAPYNVCFDGDDVAGVFDWDLAGPATRLMELGFIAWNCVPLWRDIGDEACAERIRRICSAYGGVHPAQIADVVPRRIQTMLGWIPLGAAAGDAGLRRLMSQGEPKRSLRQRSMNWSRNCGEFGYFSTDLLPGGVGHQAA